MSFLLLRARHSSCSALRGAVGEDELTLSVPTPLFAAAATDTVAMQEPARSPSRLWRRRLSAHQEDNTVERRASTDSQRRSLHPLQLSSTLRYSEDSQRSGSGSSDSTNRSASDRLGNLRRFTSLSRRRGSSVELLDDLSPGYYKSRSVSSPSSGSRSPDGMTLEDVPEIKHGLAPSPNLSLEGSSPPSSHPLTPMQSHSAPFSYASSPALAPPAPVGPGREVKKECVSSCAKGFR